MIHLDAVLHQLMDADKGRYLTQSLFSFLVVEDFLPGLSPTARWWKRRQVCA
jgi:hypothetical protein